MNKTKDCRFFIGIIPLNVQPPDNKTKAAERIHGFCYDYII